MKTEIFDYHLPKELIAQKPLDKKDESRMLVVNRATKEIIPCKFKDIFNFIDKNYMLIFNNTKVIKARLFGKKETGAKIELFIIEKLSNNEFIAFTKPAKRLKLNDKVIITDNIYCTIIEILDNGKRKIKFNIDNIIEKLNDIGQIPLPPYIKQEINDLKKYQTIFAKKDGSVAAPTAAFHFTENIFNEMKIRQIKYDFVTLHVGPGTFKPVSVENIENHEMHSEYFEITKECANNIIDYKKNKKKYLQLEQPLQEH